jgi:hypothetical protein
VSYLLPAQQHRLRPVLISMALQTWEYTDM